jgi:hypothetical protein
MLTKDICPFFHWLYSPLGPLPLIFQFHDHFTVGRTPWMSDQLVTRPLPKHRTTQTKNKYIHTPNLHALCGIRNHNLSFRVSKDSSCLRPLGYSDQHIRPLPIKIMQLSQPFVWVLRFKSHSADGRINDMEITSISSLVLTKPHVASRK